jgi:hypothetical protein
MFEYIDRDDLIRMSTYAALVAIGFAMGVQILAELLIMKLNTGVTTALATHQSDTEMMIISTSNMLMKPVGILGMGLLSPAIIQAFWDNLQGEPHGTD